MFEPDLTSSQRYVKFVAALQSYTPEESPYLNPCRQIPNVRKFKITNLADHHPVLLKAGIEKRKGDPKIDTDPYINKSLNRYIGHQFRRLHNNRNNMTAYWRLGEHLLKRSSSYLSLSLFETLPGWHRSKPYPKIWAAVKATRKLSFNNYDHFAVAIAKNGITGEKRYLQVPDLSWRIYLHGLNNIMMVWLDNFQSLYQHGFLKHRGTSTAWKQIHHEALDSPNIYEFDLRKFFDSINLDYLSDLLPRTGMPKALCRKIIKMCRTPAKNMEHSIHRWKSPQHEAEDYQYHVTKTWKSLATYEEMHYWLDQKRAAEEHRPILGRYDYYHGVSQGNPISPLISTLILTKCLLRNPGSHYVQYADDGILYNITLPITEILKFPAASGIEVHWAKSRWIRRDGVWLHPLKFLGMEFNPVTLQTTKIIPSRQIRQGGTLSNATRTKRPFTYEDFDTIENAWEYDKIVSPGAEDRIDDPQSFMEWFKTGYLGYVTACIYAGRRDIAKVTQNFVYRFVRNSWADQDRKKKGSLAYYRYVNRRKHPIKLDVFNSSSIAQRAIANRIHKALPRGKVNGFR